VTRRRIRDRSGGRLNERSIFLLDGTGALVTAGLTGILLPTIPAWHGIPAPILYALASLGLVYSAYSLSCFFGSRPIRGWMLRGIIGANLAYCLIAVILVFSLEPLTFWGRAYLIAESMVIFGLVLLEVRVYRSSLEELVVTSAV
jgi:hypothetical protein